MYRLNCFIHLPVAIPFSKALDLSVFKDRILEAKMRLNREIALVQGRKEDQGYVERIGSLKLDRIIIMN